MKSIRRIWVILIVVFLAFAGTAYWLYQAGYIKVTEGLSSGPGTKE